MPCMSVDEPKKPPRLGDVRTMLLSSPTVDSRSGAWHGIRNESTRPDFPESLSHSAYASIKQGKC